MPARRRVTSRRPLVFVVLLALAALGAAAALALLPAAGQTASAQGSASLEECHNLYLDMYVDNNDMHFTVANRNDEETIANVMVKFKRDAAADDDQTSQWTRAAATQFIAGYGTAWVSDAPDYIVHWLLPAVPPGTSYRARIGPGSSLAPVRQSISRNTVTMEQRVPGADTALCRTTREFWSRKGGTYVRAFAGVYKIGELSVDNRYPAPGGNVNFKVVGDSQDSVSASVKVQHTSGLEFQTEGTPPSNKAPVIKPTPQSPRTLPLAVWQHYNATTGVGEFYIGNEGVTSIAARPEISLTLPLKLKSGVSADGQCLTATITATPKYANPNTPGENYDDPADNTKTVCLGKPPTDELPVLLTDGPADLLNLVGCASRTDYPCEATDPATPNRVELVVAGNDAAVNAGMPYQYFQPEDVVVQIPDPAGRNTVTGESGIFWWSGSDQASTGANHPGIEPGVAGYNTSECLADKDPNNSPDDDPEYKGWKLAIANITDGQGNTIDHTPGSMTLWDISSVENHSFGYVDVDGGNNLGRELEYPDDKLCGTSFLYTYEFGKLGTYKVDFTNETKYQDANATAYSDTARYTFHVGPAAELSVADGDDVPALASGQTAYTLDLSNHGPDPSVAAKVAVQLPADATGVATVPANLGTFHAAGTTAGVAHGPYWIWDAGELLQSDFSRVAGRPQGGVVSLIVTGVSSGATATATVSNGNGSCSVSSTTLTHVIREADCKAVTGATWTAANPYTVCIDTDHLRLLDVTPKPANQTACEATTGNKWYAGTVLDHRPGNNTATLTARGGGAGLSGWSAAPGVGRPTVMLNWPAATAAVEYRIFRSADGKLGSYRQIKRVDQDTLTYTDAADVLKENETYYYQVEALYPNKRLADIYATSITATLKARSPHAPYSVSGLKAARTADNENIIAVTWTAPSNATAATRYDVQYQTRLGNTGNYGDWTAAATKQAGLAYTITGAGGGTSYRIQVRAVNVVGDDSYESGWSTATVGTVAAPDQVGNLQARRTPNNLTNIIVSWDAPSVGATPDGYDVQYRENNGDWQTAATKQAGLTYTHGNAKGASSYQFRVRTVIESGSDDVPGSWRTTGTVSKVPNPGAVSGLTAARTATDETKIDVTWTAPSGGTTPSGYDVAYRVNGSGDWQTTDLTVTGTTAELTGASGNSTYQFRVRGVKTLTHTNNTVENLAGSWRTSSTVPKVSAPNRVTGLTATRSDTDETKITVTWTAPSSGDTPTGYDVEYKQDGGNTWNTGTTVTHPTVTHTFTVAGGSSYQYRVRAFRTLTSTNEKLEGSWTTSGTVRGLPAGPVTNLTATRNTADKTTIDVSWSASNRATGYDVQYRKNSGSWSTGASKQTGLTYTQTDAGGVETYQFRVRGVSGAGNGDWTESAQVGPPPLEWQGYEVGPTVADGKMAWITLKMASGPWWYEYRNHVGDWSSCKRVAAGSHTITNLRAPITYIVEIFDAAGCDNGDRIRRENITTVDVQDTILDGKDPNNHTHKRQYPRLGVLGEGDCASDRMWHSHGWPNSGNWYGQHWHCQIYQ